MTSAPAHGAPEDAVPTVGTALARILHIRRHAYNYKWSQAAARFPHLTSTDAESFFTRDLAPLIEAVEALSPDQAETVSDAAVDVGLQATGLRLLGQNAPNPWVTQLWRTVLPVLAAHVVADPVAVVSDLSNATAQFDSHPSARPEQWLRLLRELGPKASDREQLRLLGPVLAWRSGLAHYRSGAIGSARQLPDPLRTEALELPVPQPFEQFAAELEASPWPLTQRSAQSEPGLLTRVGAFRGFGGPFPVPPTLATRRTDLIARSGDRNWLITADLFGATLHRTDDPGDYSGPNVRQPVQLFGGSMLFADGRVTDFSDSSPITGIVQGNGFAAVTTEHSHVIRFIATELAPQISDGSQ